MRALILWAEPASTNLGVQVLAAGTAAMARRAFGSHLNVSYQGYGPGDAPAELGRDPRLALRIIRPRDQVADWMRSFDLVLDTRAGDSFADVYGLPRLRRMSLLHETAVRLRVPVILTPQTIGPFTTTSGRLMARRTLRSASGVMARDRASLALAHTLGAPGALLTTDVVFALDAPPASAPSRDVVFNVSGLLWGPNPHVDHVRYQRIVRELVDGLQAQGRSVSFLAHVLDSPLADNDVPVVRALADEFGVDPIVPHGLQDVRAVLAQSRLVLGSRMHACLNAISVGTPAIPLAYSRKFAPLLEELGVTSTVDLRSEDAPVHRALSLSQDPSVLDLTQIRTRAEAAMHSAVEFLKRQV